MTKYPTKGCWLNSQTNKIEKDNIEVLEILTDSAYFKTKESVFIQLLEQIKRELKQTTIAYSITENSEIFFL